ncbi:MAG: hypothetical protein ACTSU5_04860, partial [Promethearchaeota archaeon]
MGVKKAWGELGEGNVDAAIVVLDDLAEAEREQVRSRAGEVAVGPTGEMSIAAGEPLDSVIGKLDLVLDEIESCSTPRKLLGTVSAIAGLLHELKKKSLEEQEEARRRAKEEEEARAAEEERVRAREAAKVELEDLRHRVAAARESGDLEGASELLSEASGICKEWEIADEGAWVAEESRLVEAEAEAREKLQFEFERYEEDFQNALGDNKLEECLEIIPELVDLSTALRMPEKTEHYRQLDEEIKGNIEKREELERLQREKLGEIEALKNSAAKLEARLKFADAKEKYGAIIERANEIGDELSAAYAREKIAQIERWEQEVSSSDYAKWDIPPFKLINRKRYDFLEIVPSKSAAEHRISEYSGEGKKAGNLVPVGMVRSRFKNQGPYGPDGKCFVIYERRELEDAHIFKLELPL